METRSIFSMADAEERVRADYPPSESVLEYWNKVYEALIKP